MGITDSERELREVFSGLAPGVDLMADQSSGVPRFRTDPASRVKITRGLALVEEVEQSISDLPADLQAEALRFLRVWRSRFEAAAAAVIEADAGDALQRAAKG